MSKAFVIIGIVALTQLSRIGCFKFSITRALNSTEALKTNWCHVEVITDSDNNEATVKVDIPSTLSYSVDAFCKKMKSIATGSKDFDNYSLCGLTQLYFLSQISHRKILNAKHNKKRGIFIFFANDVKEILQVGLNEKIKGTFYAAPHKLVKEVEGKKTTVIDENDGFQAVSGVFPIWWLPKNCSRISATVIDTGGVYYNYYGIQNFKISFPDLMVVEEFKNFK